MPIIGKQFPVTALTAADIADGIISEDKLASNSVSEAKMKDDAISLVELKAGTDGQIITWDASGNPTAVGPGTDGQVLTSTGSGSPPAFEAVSAGKVNQFVVGGNGTSAYQGNGFGTYSSSYQDTINVTITPSATNSRIEVFGNFYISTGGNAGEYQVYREISGGSSSELNVFTFNASSSNHNAYIGAKDTSHNTTSAITYKIRIKNNGVGHYTYINSNGSTTKLALFAVEILA